MSACGVFIDDPRYQLTELEAEILRVEALLSKLFQRRVPLKRNINRRFSPMLSLPVELCSGIFTMCFSPARPDSPLLLGQVCSAWRNLAWSMPWLWTNIYLCSAHPTDVHVQLLEEWIARSTNLPLSVHLKIRLGSPDVNMRDIAHIMDAVARCSQRWRIVNFDVPFFYPADSSMSSLGPTNFPLLTSATIRVKHFYTTLDMFVGAPLLRDVHLVGFPRKSLELPWDNITSLRLNPTTIQQCLEVLSIAQNLITNIIRSDVLDPTLVIAPNLQHLEIISFTHTPISELLDTLLVPNVLNLSFHVTGNTFPHWSFISLTVRSNCTLRHLTLNAVRNIGMATLGLSPGGCVACGTPPHRHAVYHEGYYSRAEPTQPANAWATAIRRPSYPSSESLHFCVVANTAHARWTGAVVTKMEKIRFETSAPAVFGPEEKAQL
ncbi:hypothetical protein C0995_012483, partial [Termitomyces sp. Mi166